MMEWISVEDKSPEDEKLILVVNDLGDITVGSREVKSDGVAWRIGNGCVSWDYDFNYDFSVTHWMPLPEPPTPNPEQK